MAKVLFIDDDPDWQQTLQELLATAGHQSHRATTFETAINILNSKEIYDLIVFDLRLGKALSNSDQFIWLDAFVKGMKARNLHIPSVIVVTGVDVTKQDIVKL